MTKFVIFSWRSQPIEKFFQNYTDPINPINPNVQNIDLIPIWAQMKSSIWRMRQIPEIPLWPIKWIKWKVENFPMSNNME